MPSGESTSVLEALEVLCKASEESLRPHKTELKAAVQRLQSLIEYHSTTVVATTCRDVSPPTANNPGPNESSALPSTGKDPSAPSPDQRTPPQPSPVAPSSIENFVVKLDTELKKIQELLSQVSYKPATCEPIWTIDDPRVVDLQIAGGSQSSPTTKLRRGLSQRSLAAEFDDWERNTYGTSKVEARSSHPSVEPSRKLGHIAKFLDHNRDRFHNISAARAGIEHGIKLLICETLLGGVGLSAILVFQYTRFREIKFEELDGLKDAIKGADRVRKFAEEKADWFDHCQRDYNAWYNTVSSPNGFRSPQKAGTKRRRRGSSKWPEPREPHDPSQHLNGTSLDDRGGAEALATSGRNTQVTTASMPNTATTSPFQQNQSHQHGQSQQSSGSYLPSTHANPLHCFDDGVRPSGCGDTNTSNTSGRAMDGSGHLANSDVCELGWKNPFDPSSYVGQGNQAFGPPSGRQMGTTSFDPSSYIPQGNPVFGTPPQRQMGSPSFDPSGYYHQENSAFGMLFQGQVGTTSSGF